MRHHGLNAPFGQLAVSDLAPFRRSDKACLAYAVRREVVVQHELVFAFTFDRIDDLGIAARSECRRNNRLSFTTRKD